MSDHERIWLQAANDAAEYGRLWCQNKVWPDHPDDSEPTEYVRADLLSQARAEGRREGLEEAARLAETYDCSVDAYHMASFAEHPSAVAGVMRRDFAIAKAIRELCKDRSDAA